MTAPKGVGGDAEVGFWVGEKVVNPKRLPSSKTYYLARQTTELTPAVWGVLRQYHVPLFLNLRYGRDFGPTTVGSAAPTDALTLVRHANALGVPVIAWLVVPTKDGYWADKVNAAVIVAAAHDWYAWERRNDLHFREIVLDQEMPWSLTGHVVHALGRPATLDRIMRRNINTTAQCAATDAYQNLISWMHVRGVRITETPIPFALDDVADGHMAVQDALDMAAFPPLGYNEIYLQAYRTGARQALHADPGSAWVAAYYETMQKDFGAAGQVTLGTVGRAPYNQLGPLVTDVRMLSGLGATQIPIYDLENTLATFGINGLRTLILAGHDPLEGRALAAATRPTTESIRGRAFYDQLGADAVHATPAGPGGHGTSAKSYPDGCGVPTAQPLR